MGFINGFIGAVLGNIGQGVQGLIGATGVTGAGLGPSNTLSGSSQRIGVFSSPYSNSSMWASQKAYNQPADDDPVPLLKELEAQEKERERVGRIEKSNTRLIVENYNLKKRIDCLTKKSQCPGCLNKRGCWYDRESWYQST